MLDLQLIFLTILNPFHREKVLEIVSGIIKKYGGSPSLVSVSKRKKELISTPPPGFIDPISEI